MPILKHMRQYRQFKIKKKTRRSKVLLLLGCQHFKWFIIGSRYFWSLAKVVSQNFCQSSFPPLKTTLTLLLPLLHPRLIFLRQSLPPIQTWTTKESNLITSPLQNSQCHPLGSPKGKIRQTLLQLDTSRSKGPDGIPAIVLKTCAPELAPILNKLFQLSYTLGTFPTSWKQAHVFPIPKKATNLIHSTIVPLQSLHSSLKLWRPSSLNNFLPSLKQTIFSLITSMAFESQVY